MNIFLRITAEELGRFLLAYHRRIFEPRSLGQAFNLYYGLKDNQLARLNSDSETMEYIRNTYIGRLD